MGDLTLTGLDEAILGRLSKQANDHGRSIEAEAADILSHHLGQQPAMAATVSIWEKLAETRRQTGPLPVNTVDLLREDRDAREADECG